MTERHDPTPHPPETGRFEIRFTGHLDERWTEWFDGMTVRHDTDGTTGITGEVADPVIQPALAPHVEGDGPKVA